MVRAMLVSWEKKEREGREMREGVRK